MAFDPYREAKERLIDKVLDLTNERDFRLAVTIDGLSRQEAERFLDALLIALREPDDAMCMSGAVDYAVTSDTRRVWRGMVDVLLTGQSSELDRTRGPFECTICCDVGLIRTSDPARPSDYCPGQGCKARDKWTMNKFRRMVRK
jgi:hypothetical protein